MRAKVKTAWRQASKLHGATAGYVSLVDRGANETPFKEIKAAKGAGAMGIKKRTDIIKSHKKIAKGKKEVPTVETKTVMAKLVFSKDHFESEQEVKDWIAKADWEGEDVVITEDDENFTARPDGTDDNTFKKLASVDTDEEGVTAFVGTVEVQAKAEDASEDDEDDAEDDDASGDDDDDAEDEDDEDEPVQKTAPKTPAKKADDPAPAPAKVSKRATFIAKSKDAVKKFSGWDAFYAQKNTLSEALEAGMKWDATPPGFYDVQAAFNGVVQAILGDETDGMDKKGALSKAAADYADILVGMDSFFDSYINAGEETVEKAMPDAAQKIAKWAEGYAQFVGGVTEEPAPVQKSSTPVVETKETASIADLIAKAIGPVTDKIEEVASTVSKMAERRPTKKSADLTDASSGARQQATKSEAEVTDDWVARKQRKALIG